MRVKAGLQSKLTAPAKAGAGRFKRLSLRYVLVAGTFLCASAMGVHAYESGLEGLASARTEAGRAYRDGPPLGFSGGFGEDHCQACHSDNTVNAGGGSLTISVPGRYAPGKSYPVTITLKRPRMAMGGFVFTARFEEDSSQAGTLTFADSLKERVKVVTDRGVQYAYHSRPGTQLTGTDVVRWTLRWTAPTGKRVVLFHAAANAANGDDSQSGDFIYTSRARSRGR